ncbi:MAG: hypothetical protein N3B21_01860 [Clostridia bacterium]|nr:hypothetical protein [Clostridia bacterium]
MKRAALALRGGNTLEEVVLFFICFGEMQMGWEETFIYLAVKKH